MHRACFICSCTDAAIRRIASAEDDRLETDVCFGSSDMDATDRQEVLRGSSVGVATVLARYLMTFSTDLVPQLHLCHLHWFVSIQYVGNLN
jgi:hypothetical protein